MKMVSSSGVHAPDCTAFSMGWTVPKPMRLTGGRLTRRQDHPRRADDSPGGGPFIVDDKEADDKGRRLPTPSHFHYIAHRGACGKPQVVSYNRWPRPKPMDQGGDL